MRRDPSANDRLRLVNRNECVREDQEMFLNDRPSLALLVVRAVRKARNLAIRPPFSRGAIIVERDANRSANRDQDTICVEGQVESVRMTASIARRFVGPVLPR